MPHKKGYLQMSDYECLRKDCCHIRLDTEKQLDSIIEDMFDGIYITDGQANTLRANKAYEMITGISRADIIGCNMKQLEASGTISQSGSLIAIRTGKPVTLQQKFSTGRQALITSTPVFGHDNKIEMVITNVRDMTEINHLREEIEYQNEERLRLHKELEHIRTHVLDKTDFIAADKVTLSIIHMADKVSPLDTTVMISGETGVGKEVFAQYVHSKSRRSKKSFISVNCGAIPAGLIESELFGYERGAFTGADKNGKAGLFEVADQGTIFLDEIGELPLNMQVKLLRVLQEHEVKRIGGIKPIPIDIRVIAATNRNLEEMVKKKKFRKDLYYRMMVFPLHIPPLRERRNDIVPLAELFLDQLNRKYAFRKYFSEAALRLMIEYDWPGNIRELRNIVERAVIVTDSDEITAMNTFITPCKHAEPAYLPEKRPETVHDLKAALADIEAEYIDFAYKTYGNVRLAAESLGMSHATFVRKRQRYTASHNHTVKEQPSA